MKYPVRCEIIDVTHSTWHGFPIRTPEASIPHIGKRGTARRINHEVIIELDDGSKLRGIECWWVELK